MAIKIITLMVILIQCVLDARHCAKGFLSTISFNPHNNL